VGSKSDPNERYPGPSVLSKSFSGLPLSLLPSAFIFITTFTASVFQLFPRHTLKRTQPVFSYLVHYRHYFFISSFIVIPLSVLITATYLHSLLDRPLTNTPQTIYYVHSLSQHTLVKLSFQPHWYSLLSRIKGPTILITRFNHASPYVLPKIP